MKKTVLILGGTGMLGSAVGPVFQNQPDKYDTWLTARDTSLSYGSIDNWIGFDPTGGHRPAQLAFSNITSVFEIMQTKPDYVINCIGTIKPFMAQNRANSIYINALFPHKLAETCKELGIKLIHITSDCVFSGKEGKYTEISLHDALDDYGKARALANPPTMLW